MMGIGGISMSGLAEVLLKEGFTVTGSDRGQKELTTKLESEGARIEYTQTAANVEKFPGVDVVVYTAAIHPDNPEFAAFADAGVPMLTRAELLGQIMSNYKHSIAISGTHGKTTVTSMIAHIMLAAGENPTISVGGMLPIIGGNIHIGSRDMFVTEACEYTNSFLEFYPTIGIILNIEADHLDFFKDINDIRNSFKEFVGTLPKDGSGTVVINSKIDNFKEIIEGFYGRVITYGEFDGEVRAENIQYDSSAFASFNLIVNNEYVDRIQLRVPGRHNVDNALAAISAAIKLGINPGAFKEGLISFSGAERRFEKKGQLGDIVIFDDYAHHPQEIEATLSAAEHYPHKRLICVFQPHTYTRTKSLLNDFVKALSLADQVIMPDIYAARETDTLGVSSKTVVDLINEKHPGKAHYIPSFGEVENYLLANLEAGDMVITMGAGDVYLIGERLLGK